MKKLLLLLLITAGIYGQDFTDINTFQTSDSTYWKQLDGKYTYVYIAVNDTGSTYTDSIKAYSIVKIGSDSVIANVTLRKISDGSYTDCAATNTAGGITKYLILDAYIERLYLVFSNAEFIAGRKVKTYIMGIKR